LEESFCGVNISELCAVEVIKYCEKILVTSRCVA